MALGNRELHVDASKDDIRPGLTIEGSLTLIVTLDDSLDTTKLREVPLDVLKVGFTSSQRATTLLGSSNGIRIAKAKGVGVSTISVSGIEKVLGLLSTDLRGEVLGIADLIDTRSLVKVARNVIWVRGSLLQLEVHDQVKGHVNFSDEVGAPGGNSREGPDLGNGTVDKLKEVVLIALTGPEGLSIGSNSHGGEEKNKLESHFEDFL
jgi:hypothetical protein